MRFTNRLTNRSLFQASNGKKLKQLEKFITETQGFNKHFYGEIQFTHQGCVSTYSPYITVTPDVQPEMVWRLLIKQWELSEPNAIVSLTGEFEKSESAWTEVINQAWLVTTGSSPCLHRSSNSCMIAIIPFSKLSDKNQFFSELTEGCFPIIQQGTVTRSSGKLDAHHTHFILVDGDLNSTITMRQNILNYIGNLPQNENSSTTMYKTIPVVNVMVTEDEESWKIISLATTSSSFPVVIADTAPVTYEIVKNAVLSAQLQLPLEVEPWQIPRDIKASCSFDQSLKDEIERCVNMWLLQPHTVTLYSRAANQKPTEALMKAMINSSIFSRRSMIHMAVAWNMMETIRTLLYSWKQFEDEEHDLFAYLSIALTYDSAEFLQYFEELGINISSCLTVHLLRSLYHELLRNKQFETATTFVVQKLLNNRFSFGTGDLLYSIGRIVSNLTNHEVSGLYMDKIYRKKSLCQFHANPSFGSKRLLLSAASESEESVKVPHPERDLFLWSIFFGKYKLATVFWKQCSSLAALSVIASAVIKGEADALDASTFDDALAEELNKNAKIWTNRAVGLIEQSYKQSRKMTLLYLTMPLDNYGGCTTLNLAYFTRQIEFVAHPALQNALDSIWLGKTKKDTARWRALLALICPFFVPWLDVVKKSNSLENLKAQGMLSTLAVRNEETSTSRQTGCRVIVSKEQSESIKSKPKRYIVRLKKYGTPIHDYFNSPVIKFWVHLIFLCIAIACTSVTLVDGSRVYHSVNITCSHSVSKPPAISTMNLPILIWLIAYMLGIAVDEIRQIVTANIDSYRGRFQKWFSSYWNIIDMITFLSFVVGELIYVLSPMTCVSMISFKLFFAIPITTMLLRFFQSYYVFRYIGPKVYMIKEMIKDLSVFLYIMVPVFFCYGIILSSFMADFRDYKMHGNKSDYETNILKFYNFVLYRPFWQLFVSATANVSDPQEDLAGLANTLLTAAYLLFSNMLMINLLIAMFSYTFEQIQENANLYWKYQRFEIVQEFRDRPVLPSPFFIIEDFFRVLQCCRKKSPVDRRELEKISTTLDVKDIWNFEKEILQEQLKLEHEKTN